MYLIITYDVHRKRVQRVMKILRKYLLHVQNSVFEGSLTESKLNQLKREVEKCIDTQYDHIVIYRLESRKYCYKEELGPSRATDFIL